LDTLQRLQLSQATQQIPEARKILDIGCGRGAFVRQVAQVFSQAQLTGMDISEKSITHARTRPHDRIHYRVASVEDMPFEDESYDLIFACRTFHHWINKQKGLQEIARILSSDGLFILGDGFAQGLLERPWVRRIAEALDGGSVVTIPQWQQMLQMARLEPTDSIDLPRTGGTLSIYTMTKL